MQKYGDYVPDLTDEWEGKEGRTLPTVTVQDLRSSYVEAGNAVPGGYQKWWSKTFRRVINDNEVWKLYSLSDNIFTNIYKYSQSTVILIIIDRYNMYLN